MDHLFQKLSNLFNFLQNSLATKYVNPIQCTFEYRGKYTPKHINSNLGKKILLFTAEFMHSDYFLLSDLRVDIW